MDYSSLRVELCDFSTGCYDIYWSEIAGNLFNSRWESK